MADAVTVIWGERHVVTQCICCAVWHTVPEIVYKHCQKEGGFVHCPNGHSYGWKEGTKARDELRRERDRLKQDAARLEEEIAAEKNRADEAQRKYLQARKRAAAGVCPCCNRSFINVQRHMKSKHPNVVPLDQKSA